MLGSFKKIKIKLDLLTEIDMLLMVEKCIRGEICHWTYRHGKTNNKYMTNYDENKESLYLKYLAVNKLSVNDFKWVEFKWSINLIS